MKKDIFSKLSEMDEFGLSHQTIELKKYLPLLPSNLDLVQSKVNKLFYGEFQYHKQLKREKRGQVEVPVRERVFFDIPFPGTGYYGLNHLEFTRKGNSWATSEMGYGYTTTASDIPTWLKIDEKKKIRCQHEKLYGFRIDIWVHKGLVAGIPSRVSHTIRDHENSDYCFHYRFEFSSDEDAKRFAEFLSRQDTMSPDEKVRHMWHGATFRWDNLRFIDNRFKVDEPQVEKLNKILCSRFSFPSYIRCQRNGKDYEKELEKVREKIGWADIKEVLFS